MSLIEALQKLVDSEDSTGQSDQYSLVSREAVAELRSILADTGGRDPYRAVTELIAAADDIERNWTKNLSSAAQRLATVADDWRDLVESQEEYNG